MLNLRNDLKLSHSCLARTYTIATDDRHVIKLAITDHLYRKLLCDYDNDHNDVDGAN